MSSMVGKHPVKVINTKQRFIKHPVDFLLIPASSNVCPEAAPNVKISDSETSISDASPEFKVKVHILGNFCFHYALINIRTRLEN
jgi:hypothetical protein